MIVLLFFLLLCFARIVFIVDFPEGFLQLYEIGVLFFLNFGTFGCILFQGLELFLELCYLFLKRGLSLFGLFVFEKLELLLLLFPQTCVILYLFLVILNDGIFGFDLVLQIVYSQ